MDLTWCILDANAYQFNLQFLHLHLGRSGIHIHNRNLIQIQAQIHTRR